MATLTNKASCNYNILGVNFFINSNTVNLEYTYNGQIINTNSSVAFEKRDKNIWIVPIPIRVVVVAQDLISLKP